MAQETTQTHNNGSSMPADGATDYARKEQAFAQLMSAAHYLCFGIPLNIHFADEHVPLYHTQNDVFYTRARPSEVPSGTSGTDAPEDRKGHADMPDSAADAETAAEAPTAAHGIAPATLISAVASNGASTSGSVSDGSLDMSWYVVTRGYDTGVFDSLALAQSLTFKCPGQNYKKFKSEYFMTAHSPEMETETQPQASSPDNHPRRHKVCVAAEPLRARTCSRCELLDAEKASLLEVLVELNTLRAEIELLRYSNMLIKQELIQRHPSKSFLKDHLEQLRDLATHIEDSY
ncbi:hypothetical protein PUNSTDRAFT_130516 [Punctularia strigosozonata HHB-11173 SS5]|uniref:uncharacterized protein n=1 Tax=Punctularia strigosozonata (strain HHB-11173) TaxID=741275 RepID=UPI00044172CB|nr:uncharacterized protein PUNSTDRAFT_130516 [Punctularia strigosozonata HHB-11173 SS5]EIN12250.1 hypothetical protein PUNSTDRAFT_130516 [Punctularia strigosozonata HHB-11173 SS5]